MDIISALKEIKYSESSYLEQIFRTRMLSELSTQKLEKEVAAIRESEKVKLKKLNPADMPEEYAQEYEQNVQVKISQFVNEQIARLGSEVHEMFLKTHEHNSIRIEQRVRRENYVEYADFMLDRLIASGHKANPSVIELRQEFKAALTQSFSAKVMLVDDPLELPEYDITFMDIILLDNAPRVRIRYTNQTKIYQKMVEKIFQENSNLTTILSRIFTACGIIKRVGGNTPLAESAEKKVLSLIMHQLYCQTVRYKEMELQSFLYFLHKDPVGKFYWPESKKSETGEVEFSAMPPGCPVDLSVLEDMLEIRRFSPFVENAIFYDKLKI